MSPIDIQPILDAALHTLERSRVKGAGCGRFTSEAGSGGGEDPWSSAAAVNLLYGLNVLPGRNHEREEWISVLQSYQSAESGLFGRDGDGSLLLSAAVTSALSCFDSVPLHPPTELRTYLEADTFLEFTRTLCWCKDPERAARELGALFTCLTLHGEAGQEWSSIFFQWMRQETDEHTGLMRKECLAPIELEGHWTLLPYLCAFLYPLACSQYAHQPIALPWRLIDTALEVMEYHHELFYQPRGQRHLPWVLCVSRARRTTAHRFEETRQALERFAPPYLDFLRNQIRSDRFRSLGYIQWDIAVLAELQSALPGTLLSRRPLRQILDRHPFL